jgi:two-component system nitrogen regulation sensor histidine kinase NtrY
MRRFLTISAAIAAFVAASTVAEIFFMDVKAVSATGKLVFLLLFNLNLLALVVLVIYVGKILWGLLNEYRQRALGYRFKTKVMAFFLILTSIPAALLFLVASGLGSSYIDRLFTPDFRRPIEEAVQIAQQHYEAERMKALEFAEMARTGYAPPPQYTVSFLEEEPEDASASIEAAFEGRRGSEVISSEGGDVVRAALPRGPASANRGIIVVETSIPPEVTAGIATIQTTYEDYLKLEAWKSPLKMNYLLLLGFFTLIIIFSALWVSLKIAGWITEPIKRLAGATEAVAAGNLSVSVESARRDEMGLLVDSFNRMVTELREGKESLQRLYLESDRRRLAMENIVKSIQSGVISLDASGRVLAINAAACRILGAKEDDVVGKLYPAMLSAVRSEELTSFIKDIDVKTFKSEERELPVSVGGRRMLLKVSITGLRGALDRYLGLLIVVDDLTDVISAQRALAWQEVAQRMAHEIKNPLTPIKLSAERMLKKWASHDGEFDKIFERSTNTIIREVDHLKTLVDEFSRLGKMPPTAMEPTDVGSVLEEAASLYRDYRDLTINVLRTGEVPPTEVDRAQFRRVMLNLFDNAVRAMNGEGTIEVRITPDRDVGMLYVDVADQGPGIKDEDKEKLFVPYFSTEKGGTGLGLAIADRVVAEHGGHLRVRDNSPHGSIFTIELPIKEA